ncbi:unnamed protein product [Musa acuminata subsp. malaccensis]|uniref:(wild Malaysian banana) hypothetical protein n=1 Tax=Musa acuminata subsp. malaccensis TaxID=214687 RepID=A0A804J9S8_MUSAM|nr:unnamed protein product [Musa acuminata subsp. malaccensis]
MKKKNLKVKISLATKVKSLLIEDKFEPLAYPHQGVSEPYPLCADTHGYDASYHPTPISTSPISDTTISVTVDTLTATSTDIFRNPSNQHDASISRSPKVLGTAN